MLYFYLGDFGMQDYFNEVNTLIEKFFKRLLEEASIKYDYTSLTRM